MALTDESNGGGIPATMLVGPANFGGAMPYPVYTGNGGGNGNGFGGDGNGWWIILLFILLASGNWGGQNNGGNGGWFGGQPVIVNDGGNGSVQRGFDQAAIMSGINGLQATGSNLSTQLCNCCCDMQGTVNQGFNTTQLALCNGFSGVNQNVSNGFAQAEIADNARQMANMNQAFAAQTAMAQGFNNIQSQFADCCCENRLGIANLANVIQTENCADRAAISDGIRDILVNQTSNTQRILDQLCSDKIDAKNEKIADLERQLTMANLQASQVAQTARLERSNGDVIEGLYNRLVQCPVPSQPVYGNQPIFQCSGPAWNNNNGCGCGGNNF